MGNLPRLPGQPTFPGLKRTWHSKGIEAIGGTLIVRKKRQPQLWGWIYVLLGAGLSWYCLALQSKQAGSLYPGVLFGVLVAGAGIIELLPAQEILVFDTTSQLAHEITYAWLRRRKLNTLPFAYIASVGTDTLKDPRNGAVWFVESVLRLRSGRRVSAGALEDVETIGRFAGLTVDHQIVWLEEPSNPSSG